MLYMIIQYGLEPFLSLADINRFESQNEKSYIFIII